ncbi:unnamed protein product [Rotaria magnacalcarata]|uniref:Myosin motor domain-containing protein n=2 Tax=Rotaria magnacalcarata TaxID=392030 RepID=A0A816T2B5_9BILA|nr:unnamed protein product [Rotaria magnacalcarata]
MDSQITVKYGKNCKIDNEQHTIQKNGSMKDNNTGVCHDHFRIDKEQSMLSDCQKLLERNEPLDKPDKYGITLLHIAAAKAYSSVVHFLLQHYVNADQVDDTGATALHLSAKHEHGVIVKLLLDARANPTICDRFGRKPSEVCLSTSFIRALLVKAEVKFEEKRKRAEQSDDSLEEEHEEAIDSLSDDDNHDDDLQVLFKPIPQRRSMIISPILNNDNDDSSNIKMMNIFDEKLNNHTNDDRSLPTKLPNDDLALLPEISEQSLLYDLEMRYRQGQIYTYIGDILIALNPFDHLPIYGRQISELYKNTESIVSLPSHIYGCAERLYRNMLREKTSQCVVISGLSGSGKTESCKYIVQHILSRSLSVETLLNMKINQVNSLMEAFGNAKTYINNNSSRFGKYLEIHFAPTGNVLGAHLKEYLLEKSRVISHNNDEGNFHIFYYLFAGLSHDMLVRNGLRVPSEHRYMSHNIELAQLDSARQVEYRKKFQMVKQSLITIGFSAEDVQSIFTILSAILHVGDIVFVPHGSNDGVRVKNNGTIDKIAELLQLSSMELSSALVTELQVTRGEQIFRERNIIQASECRDAFAKALYGRLFSWIVNGINSYLQPVEDESSSAHTISVLDIFGFENFKSNSFEQLCINVTNEHMQRFLNQHIYDLEISDCQHEGIDTIDINYADNHLVIETFFNKHSGILAILDEESRFPQATDQTLATKLHHGPGVQFRDIYSIPKDGGTTFTIRHYAAPVVYNMVGLLEKNRDFLPNSIVFVARTSNNLIVQELFRMNLNEKGVLPASPSLRHQQHHPNTFHANRDIKRNDISFNHGVKYSSHLQQPSRTLPEKSNGNTFERTGGTAMRTVAFHFKHSLSELIEKMTACQCHFVRCIKPNELRDKTTSLTVPCVTRQLRYSGVLQMCEIRKKGYPLRIQFDEFLHRYNALVLCLLPITTDDRSKELSLSSLTFSRDRAIECLKRAGIDNYKVGHTKLLFRYWHSDQLHNLAVQYEKKVNVCQKVLRGWLARRKYSRLREVHQLQLVFIRKFCDDIALTGQLYKTKMDNHCQYDKKRKLKQNVQPKANDADEEQIEKTMNYFDSLIDPYLSDQETNTENKSRRSLTTSTNIPQVKPISHTNGTTLVQQVKQEFDGNVSSNTSSSTSSASSQKVPQRPVDIHASHFHQFQNIRCRFEQMTSGVTNASTNNVRRYTSENNLNEMSPSSKPLLQPKVPRLVSVQTTATATSTEDLSNIPSWKKLSPQARLSALLDKTNHTSSLSSNGTSASLIDLTSIDKLSTNKQFQPAPTARPRFRFVPSSDQNSVLKEEPEPEQQSTQSNISYDNYNIKSLSPNRTSINNHNNQQQQISDAKQPNNLIKPSVIHPSQMSRSTVFTQSDINIHHQNGNSAFKPHISQQTKLMKSSIQLSSNQINGNNFQHPIAATQNIIHPLGITNSNGMIYKTQQPPPVPNIKRTESVYKPGVHVGITNPSGPSSANGLITRQHQQTVPQFHQSMLNLSSIGASETTNLNQQPMDMFGSRVSLHSSSSNFMKHPAYAQQQQQQPNKTNGHPQYNNNNQNNHNHHHHPPPPNSSAFRPPPAIVEDPILRWIQQVNNSGNVNSLTSNGGGNRSQQQNYPYAPYVSTGSTVQPTVMNGLDHLHRQQQQQQQQQPQQPYLNQVNVHKHHVPQHTVPVQAGYLVSPPVSRNGISPSLTANIYHFNHHNSQQIPPSSGGGQSRPHSQRQDVTVTTYL